MGMHGTGLEVIDPDGTSMRLSRFALDDIRFGTKADSFTLTRLGAAPITVVATEGADRTLVSHVGRSGGFISTR